jgi:dihydroorotase
MNETILIHEARIINEGKIFESDVLIKNQRIEHIGSERPSGRYTDTDAKGLYLMPGIIDDQVHFREPGYTHKGDIASESRAAVAGGVTSFMEMPNTRPLATSKERLEEKYTIASTNAFANYSFYLGATDHNLDEIKNIAVGDVCGVKIFMGSSTGDLLVKDLKSLERIFEESPTLIATHCEDEDLFQQKLEEYKIKFADQIPARCHEYIRSAEGCLMSSTRAVALARQFNSRLHVLHITTEDELSLFSNAVPLEHKHITSEVCVHHLYFDSNDYESLGNKIKCNPSIKAPQHRKALMQALLDGRLDVIATDHAPHTLEEKIGSYLNAASGLPLIQHSLQVMLSFYHEGMISLEHIINKMCHAPAVCFKIKDRGYIREGFFADLVLFNPNERILVTNEDLLYKCHWSPLEGAQLYGKIDTTWVNGYPVYTQGKVNEAGRGMRLRFAR